MKMHEDHPEQREAAQNVERMNTLGLGQRGTGCQPQHRAIVAAAG
jgi:hypothetical protein